MTPVPRGHHDRDRGKRGRPPVIFVAWGAVGGRSREVAAALGGEALLLFPPESRWRPHATVRYVLCTGATVVHLLRRRPKSIVVTNPPILAGLVAWGISKVLRCPIVLDSHPGGFGAQGDKVAARLQRLHRWLVPRCTGCAVASPPWAAVVEEWGGRAMELHEAPRHPAQIDEPAATTAPHEPLRILCVGRLARDEPTDEVLTAAAALPDCHFLVTGDVARRPGVSEGAPDNVTFTGFLRPEAYDRALRDADVVMTLTTEPTSVMRAAYEAVYMRRPLIVTDWPIGRAVFPWAVHVTNDAAAIAAGVTLAHERIEELNAVAERACVLQTERWDQQLQTLRSMLGISAHATTRPASRPGP